MFDQGLHVFGDVFGAMALGDGINQDLLNGATLFKGFGELQVYGLAGAHITLVGQTPAQAQISQKASIFLGFWLGAKSHHLLDIMAGSV
jgi:hypothetical protein